MSLPATVVPAEAPAVRHFSLRERLLLTLFSAAGYGAIRLLAPTVRMYVSFEEGGRSHEPQHPTIYSFWHRCTFVGSYCMRNEAGASMVSRSFDGEYIARILEKLGYIAVRGSSSRGGAVALREMHTMVEQGHSVTFAADGPRGPRYVAKPGPMLLARNTGAPVVAFHVALENPFILPSWDEFMLPRPFNRGVMRISRPMFVPSDADDATLERLHGELQQMMDRTRIAAEELIARRSYAGLLANRWKPVRECWVNRDFRG
jgi:lysophospholipid acyltransferase (LPLAT)-like uncharacterized protein